MVRRPCFTPLVLMRTSATLPHFRRSAAHHQDLQAVVVIQVHVQGGEDRVMEVVLDIGEFLVQQAHVVIVDQGDGAHHLAFGRFPGLLDQLVADQVAERLRAVGVAALRDQAGRTSPAGRRRSPPQSG